MKFELHNETPKTLNKTRKTPKNIHKKLTNWRNKQTGMNKLNLASIFVIWEQFGNKGGVNDTNWFKAEFDFDFKPHERTCFRFWMEELDFEWISILRWGTQDFEWISILNWVWNDFWRWWSCLRFWDEDEEKWIICRTWRKVEQEQKMILF